jgi:murein DD-endopeptidase MepM/ murein hydrolase activator NlpD
MYNTLINPYDLPLTPPMDLNGNLPGIDKISLFPMQLRTRSSIGLFGARRDATPNGANNSQWLLRLHQGIDLLAPLGTYVFASADGKVTFADGDGVTILHDYGIKFFTNSSHLRNVVVAVNDTVKSGQLIGEVNSNPSWPDETHLHFEVRYPFDASNPTYRNSLPVNSAFAMYNWEIKSFKNDDTTRHIIDNVYITSVEEIIRARHLRFLMCNVEGNNRDLFLPLQTGLPEDKSLAETLKQSFFSNRKVRIVWRESLFFSKIQSTFDKLSVIAEVKINK